MSNSATYFDSAGNTISLGRKLAGAGGEGTVYELESPKGHLAAKIYHKQPISPEQQNKLKLMVASQDATLASVSAWPVDILHLGRNGPTCGFLMPNLIGYKEIHNLYSPAYRQTKFPDTDWAFLIQASRNMAASFAKLHRYGYIIGDVSQKNVFVSSSALIKFIDCDSFQIKHGQQIFGCEVGTPLFTPPELQGKSFKQGIRTENHDNFGLAILCFHLLFMGRHPFAGVYEGSGNMSLTQAVREFRFAYSRSAYTKKIGLPPNALPLHAISPELGQMFERAFGQSGVFGKRPRALEWVSALDNLKNHLVTCSRVNTHKYYRGIGKCPWCVLEATSRFIFFDGPKQAAAAPKLDAPNIWRQIEAVSSPGMAVAPNLQFQPSPTPLPDSLKSFYAFKRMFHTKAYLQEKERRERSLADALVRSNGLVGVWQEKASNQRFVAKRNELSAMYNNYRGVIEKFLESKEQFVAQAKEVQLRHFLERYHIDQARISSIGASRKAMLASFGVETAADVSRKVILPIPGFGQALTYELLKWRNELEKRFVFDPQSGRHIGDLTRIQQQLYQKLQEIETTMISGLEELQTIKREILRTRETLSIDIKNAAIALAQARADMDVL